MQVLVATAGALSPDPVVEFARHLMGGNGSVTITTVVEVPRDFLENLDADDWHPLRDADGDGPEDVASRYLEERGLRIIDPIKQALEAARIPCDVLVLEGTDAAKEISAAADHLDVDVVVLGATKQIFDHDAWESVSARVMVESGRPVLVVPQARKHSAEEDADTAYRPAPDPIELM